MLYSYRKLHDQKRKHTRYDNDWWCPIVISFIRHSNGESTSETVIL